MTAVVEQRMDFRAAAAAAGAGAPAWLSALHVRGATLATELDWPDSHAQRPWKYYDAASIGITPETRQAHEAVALSGARMAALFAAAGSTAQKNVSSVVVPERDRLTAIHYAFVKDGVVVNVPANEEGAEPVRINRTVAGAGLATPHTLIVTGANSRVTIIEEFSSTEDELVVLPVVEIIPGSGSTVRYYAVHSWGSKTKVFLNQRFFGRERDAVLQNLHMVLSGAVVKGHLESTMEARGTASELLGVTYGTGGLQADFFTLQDHVGPDTRSDLKYKSALKDDSRAVYYGLTRVGLGARNADANQENRNLLLSKTARADSDPVLEILTSDIIRASHGATAGPVDQEQLFYMQARGIPRPDAEALLVTAFLEDVLARVPDEAVRGELIAKLEEKLDA